MNLWKPFWTDWSSTDTKAPEENSKRCLIKWCQNHLHFGFWLVRCLSGCLIQSWIVLDICGRWSRLALVVFWDKKSTKTGSTAKMREGSRCGCLWWIFSLATWQGENKSLIMNCDTLMSLSGSDNTWSALYHSTFDTNKGNCWQIRPPCHGQRENVTFKNSLLDKTW